MRSATAEGREVLTLVPFFEGDWAKHIPAPRRGSLPTRREAAVFARQCRTAFRRAGALIGGRFVVGVHTSPAFREAAYAPPLAGAWLAAAEAGATIALHPHEERVWLALRGRVAAHWRRVIMEAADRLRALGLRARAFRSGYGLLSGAMLPVLEEAGLLLDFSSAPGWHRLPGAPGWPAGFSAARWLCSRDPAHVACGHRRSRVLGVPIGGARLGRRGRWRYLVNEHSDLATLKAVWDRLRERADGRSGPRSVCFIWCGYGLARPGLADQALAFLEYVLRTGGRIPDPGALLRLVGRPEPPPRSAHGG